MKVKALHPVKVGDAWHMAGEVFEADLVDVAGGSVEMIAEEPAAAPQPAVAKAEPEPEPAKEPAKRGGIRRKAN